MSADPIEQSARELAANAFEDAGCIPEDVEAIRTGRLDGDDGIWFDLLCEILALQKETS